MDTTHRLELFSKSRAEKLWDCSRLEFLMYVYGEYGLKSLAPAFELEFGKIIHEASHAIALNRELTEQPAIAAREAMIKAAPSLQMDNQVAQQWGAIAEGLTRAYILRVWPAWLREFSVVDAEVPLVLPIDKAAGIWFVCKPDLILRHRITNELWYCVDSDTRVLTKTLRWVPANSVCAGMELLGVEESVDASRMDKNRQHRRQARHWNTGRVTSTARLQRQCSRLTFDDGTNMICSDDHQWLVPAARGKEKVGGTYRASWTATRHLHVGAKLLKVIEPWEEAEEDYNQGYLAAAFDGEGSLSQRKTLLLTFTQKQNAMLDEVRRLLNGHGIKFGVGKPNKGVYTLSICGKARILRTLGLIRPLRLLDRLNVDRLGGVQAIKKLRIIGIEHLGLRDVIAIETTNHTFIAEGIISHNCEHKTTGSVDARWINSWTKAVQVHTGIKAAERKYGEKFGGCYVLGWYKGYQDRTNQIQQSPFAWGWVNRGAPGIVAEQFSTSYQRTKGWERFPTWTLTDGLGWWVNKLDQDGLLLKQFAKTPPIMMREDLVDDFIEQLKFHANKIQSYRKYAAEAETESDAHRLLNAYFPQNFNHCDPAWGRRTCPMQQLCWQSWVAADPCASGLYVRNSPDETSEHRKEFLELIRAEEAA